MNVGFADVLVAGDSFLSNEGTLNLNDGGAILAGQSGSGSMENYGGTVNINDGAYLETAIPFYSVYGPLAVNSGGVLRIDRLGTLATDSTFSVASGGVFQLAGTLQYNGDTVAPDMISADGAATLAEGGSYALNLSALDASAPVAISSLSIDWGDGSSPTAVDVNSLADAMTLYHTFPSGTGFSDVLVTAVTVGTDTLPSFPLEIATIPVGVVPAAPTNLSATAVSSGQVVLNWTAASSTVLAGYNIYASTDGVTFKFVGAAGAGTTTYQTTDLSTGTSYSFYVTAQSDGAESIPSNSVQATTGYNPPNVDASGNSAVASGAAYSLTISATYPDGTADAVSQWSISWGDGNTATYTPQASDGPDITFTHSYANGLGVVNIVATATDADGSHSSAPLQIYTGEVVPSTPQNVAALAASNAEVDVSWADSDAAGSVNGFTIARSGDGGTTWHILGTIAGSATTYTDTKVLPLTTYLYSVSAQNIVGSSAAVPASQPSTTDSGLPTLSADLTTAADGSAVVTLSWSCAGNNIAGFELESKLDGPDASGVLHNFQHISTPGPGSASWSPTGLLPGRQYEFRIRANYTDQTVSDYVGTSVDIPLLPAPPNPANTLPAPVITGETPNPSDPYAGSVSIPWDLTFDSQSHVSMGPGGGIVFVDLTRADDPYGVLYPHTPEILYISPSDGPHYTGVLDTFLLTTGATYTVRLGIGNADTSQRSDESNSFTFTAPGALPPPLKISATPVDASGNVTIACTGPSGQALNEVEFYRVDSSGCSLWGFTNSSVNTAQITQAAGTGQYSIFAVYGDNTYVQPPYSNFVDINANSANIPAAPDLITAVLDPENDRQVDVHWHNTPNNETGYSIERSLDGGQSWSLITSTGVDQTSVTDTLPAHLPIGPNGYQVRYRVSAYNASGSSTPTMCPATITQIPTTLHREKAKTMVAAVGVRLVRIDWNEHIFDQFKNPIAGLFGYEHVFPTFYYHLFSSSKVQHQKSFVTMAGGLFFDVSQEAFFNPWGIGTGQLILTQYINAGGRYATLTTCIDDQGTTAGSTELAIFQWGSK